jgi:hypothetical protein
MIYYHIRYNIPLSLQSEYFNRLLTDLSLTENTVFLVGRRGNLGITAFLIGNKQ